MPTVFYHGKYRFYFYSNEFVSDGVLEPIHIHIEYDDNEAKFWIEPYVSLAYNKGFRSHELFDLEKVVENNIDDIILKWKKHFKLI